MLKALIRPPYFHWAASGGPVEGPLTSALYVLKGQWRWQPALSMDAAGGRAEASPPRTMLPSYIQRFTYLTRIHTDY